MHNLGALAAHCPNMVITDSEGHILHANPHLLEILDTQLGASLYDLMNKDTIKDAIGQSSLSLKLNDRDVEMVSSILNPNTVIHVIRDKHEEKQKIDAQRYTERLAMVASRTVNGVIITDKHRKIEWVNEGFTRISGYDLEDVKGRSPGEILQGPDTDPKIVEYMKQKLDKNEGFETELINYRKNGEKYWVRVEIQPLFQDGDLTGFMGIETDITHKKITEKILTKKALQQKRIAELSQFALQERNLQKIFDRTVKVVSETLDMEFCKILELREDHLLLISGVGWKEGIVGKKRLGIEKQSQAGYTLQTSKPVIVPDMTKETRFFGPDLLLDHGVVSGISCTISESNRPFGVIGVHSKKSMSFSQADTDFLLYVSNLLGIAIQRRKLEKQKDDFMSIASHELRTPLTSLKAYAQLLNNRLSSRNDDLKSIAERIDTQLNKLNTLITNFMDIRKIEKGKLPLEKERFGIDPLIQKIGEDMQMAYDSHTIQTDLRANTKIFADREKIRQVIENLVTNAIKYSPGQDKVIIRTYKNDQTIHISVQDFGQGIPKELQKKIFDQFFRGENKSIPGVGLGLYISREIISGHNGSIDVHSKINQGSTFTIKLPYDKNINR